jgi:hypothetical protein
MTHHASISPSSNGVLFDAAQPDVSRRATRAPWAASLMAMASTIDPSPAALAGWNHYFPQSTTTEIEIQAARPPHPVADRRTLASAPELIRDVLRYLGLTKTQLKDACAVSRQTLYDWLSGAFEPDAANSARLRTIHELALLVPQHAPRPLRAALLTQPIIGAASLLDLLRAPRLDLATLREAVITLSAASTVADQRTASAVRDRLGFKRLAPATETRNLDESLEELEPT